MVNKWYYSCPMGQAINTNGRNIQKPSERVLHSGGHFLQKPSRIMRNIIIALRYIFCFSQF